MKSSDMILSMFRFCLPKNVQNGSYNRYDMRKEHEIAECIKWGWIYHHIGIPTTERKENEVYIPHLKFFVSGFSTSPFGIEWMRFEEDSPMHRWSRKSACGL